MVVSVLNQMQEYRLSFGVIRLLNDRIAEVVVDEGIEMTLENVAEYHEFLIEYLPENAGLLVNKVNSYTYNFEAQQHLFLLEKIIAHAVVVHSVSSRLATESMVQIQRSRQGMNLQLFDRFDAALQWLCEELQCPLPQVSQQYFPRQSKSK